VSINAWAAPHTIKGTNYKNLPEYKAAYECAMEALRQGDSGPYSYCVGNAYDPSEIEERAFQDATKNYSANQAQGAVPEPEVKPTSQSAGNSASISPTALVTKMLELATNNGGLDYEQEIQQHKATLEQMPKPERGDRKTARLLNDQTLELLKASQYDAAVQSLLNAARLDRSDVEIVNNLGFSFLKQGNLDQAQNYLVTCLTMAPDRSAAWSNLADVLALKGNMQQSVAAYANVYRFSKNRVKTHQFLRDTNSKESNANLIQARQSAMNIAEKMYTDVVGP
jgi:tetratricopeptide (TPR) repeat protein